MLQRNANYTHVYNSLNLYAVDGKVYICCRGTEFGRTESGRWEGYPGARMRLRRAKDGWLLDCETPTTVITNSIQDAGNMQPIVGSFNDVRKKPKAVVKMMEAERQ